MQVLLELPEDIVESLRSNWGDLPRHALETLAVEGYRTGALTETQIKRLLGFPSRFEVHALLKSHRVPFRYTEADLRADVQTHRDLGILTK